MKRTAAAEKSWKGPALWGRGFRPFFLAASLWAIAAIGVWAPLFLGRIEIPTALSPRDWHIHEMIFGYGSAVVAGFLLTAIPNWTGRLPVAGLPLALICALWALGRVAVFTSAWLGPSLAGLLDALFLIVFTALAAREVIAGKNERNFKVVTLLVILAIANIGFHFEATITGSAPVSTRAGLAIIIILILLIGGRVVPSFTHNWLAKRGTAEAPVPFGKSDAAVMVVSAFALLLWTADPDGYATGIPLLAAGLANLWRLLRWRGWKTYPEPLVLILHAGFFFAALGFVVTGLHAVWANHVSLAAGVHVWAVGAIGTMTLAIMTRATLGHTGRQLIASRSTQLIYVMIVLSMIARVNMEFLPALVVPLLYAAAWILAFIGFVAIYGPMLTQPAAQPK